MSGFGDAHVMREESVVPPRRVFVWSPQNPFLLGKAWRSGLMVGRVIQAGTVVLCRVQYPGQDAELTAPPSWMHDAPPVDFARGTRSPDLRPAYGQRASAAAGTSNVVDFPVGGRA